MNHFKFTYNFLTQKNKIQIFKILKLFMVNLIPKSAKFYHFRQ
jgi:hypothetical protein